MWTSEQRQRLAVEHQILHREGFDQFSVYHYPSGDTYSASGIASSSSGRHYHLHLPIPPRYPSQRPPLYVTDPDPLRLFNGRPTNPGAAIKAAPGLASGVTPIFSPSWRSDHLRSWRLSRISFPRSDTSRVLLHRMLNLSRRKFWLCGD